MQQIKKQNKDFYFEKVNNKNVLRRIERVTDYFSKIKKLAYSKKIFNILNINNNKNVLFKDKLNFKFANGAGFLPHFDGHFYWYKNNSRKNQKGWKIYSNNFTNVAIHLENSSKKMVVYLLQVKRILLN